MIQVNDQQQQQQHLRHHQSTLGNAMKVLAHYHQYHCTKIASPQLHRV
mgnify:CR=1 FL=1